jgi:predicted Rossmann fold flavoprotein
MTSSGARRGGKTLPASASLPARRGACYASVSNMDIVIIGGGAAGLMAAASLAETYPNRRVTLIERNADLGRKVKISGGGRCNVTTGLDDLAAVLGRYPRGAAFLRAAMTEFPPVAVQAWFEAHGVPLKTEGDGRVFPVSNRGEDVVGAFERVFRLRRVEVLTGRSVAGLERSGRRFAAALGGKGETLEADRVVLAAGGQAYRHTGSQGDGYGLAEALGHRITPLAASLSAFVVKETWPAEVAGVSLTAARVTAKGQQALSFAGPLMFTHRGVTGPAVFAVSALTAFETATPAHPLPITLDLLPASSAESLAKLLVARCNEQPTRFFLNTLATVVPRSLAEVCCRETGLPDDRHAGKVGKKDARRVVGWLKAVPLEVTARPAGEEFVTAGGVDLSEVNPQTMESRIVPGLFFAGEVLDIDGFTGGFNLQAAWCTGRLAGLSAAAA